MIVSALGRRDWRQYKNKGGGRFVHFAQQKPTDGFMEKNAADPLNGQKDKQGGPGSDQA